MSTLQSSSVSSPKFLIKSLGFISAFSLMTSIISLQPLFSFFQLLPQKICSCAVKFISSSLINYIPPLRNYSTFSRRAALSVVSLLIIAVSSWFVWVEVASLSSRPSPFPSSTRVLNSCLLTLICSSSFSKREVSTSGNRSQFIRQTLAFPYSLRVTVFSATSISRAASHCLRLIVD